MVLHLVQGRSLLTDSDGGGWVAICHLCMDICLHPLYNASIEAWVLGCRTFVVLGQEA